MSRRTRITDAAISTLATDGMRGLTHRAVDHAAGLPEGSTSYYFRTRLALLTATVQRLAELEVSELAHVGMDPQDLDGFADALAPLLHRQMGAQRHRSLARYELTLEATRRPELRDQLEQVSARIRGMVAELLAGAGVAQPDDRAHDLVAFLDGLLLDSVVGGRRLDVADLSAAVRRVVVAVSG